MNQLTELAKNTVDFIAAHPDCKLADVIAYNPHYSNTPSLLKALTDRGVLTRSGEHRHYRYRWSGELYEVKGRKSPPREVVADDVPIPTGSEITEDHLLYIRGHTHLRRSELAKRLGISKLELNQVMVNHGIKSKFKPKDIDE